MGEWDQYKEEQKKRRQERLPIRVKEIEGLAERGFTVKKLSDYQFRINGTYDLYPIHNRWHNIKTNKRGGAKNLSQFIIQTNTINKIIDEGFNNGSQL